ncbi:MAG TPA: methylmalonyl Co-A mutase-associated GTPase MeaB [Alphaproteobacteria bacterium]|nr:methylmalonyl Co-A mutase-associated GTPase MeaB [Alphaproteobacteria bacterium]
MGKRDTETEIAGIVDAVVSGDRRALARAITLVESTRGDHRARAEAVLAAAMPRRGPSVRIGITGAPRVGKSTFIEAFGRHLTAAGHRVAVLAVDPSSTRTGGSILGDKTRMAELSRDPNAFIRPSPSGGGLGGVARRTREAMLLTEAAGYDVVVVETVGVGQSEYAVAEMVDMFVLLLSPGGGDGLQGIKRGIMELADLVVVNKADGMLLPAARHAATDYRGALSLMRPKVSGWSVPVLLVSALKGEGLEAIWQQVGAFREALEAAGGLEARRAAQMRHWMWQEVEANLLAALRQAPEVASLVPALERRVGQGELAPTVAARSLIKAFLKGREGKG